MNNSKLEKYKANIVEKDNAISNLEEQVNTLTQERDKLKQENTSLKKN